MPYTIHTAKAQIRDGLGNFRNIDVFSGDVEDAKTAALDEVAAAKTAALGAINAQTEDALKDIGDRANARITPDVTNNEVEAMFAPIFDTTTAYTAGTYVRNADGSTNKLYRLTADHAANTTWADTSKIEVKIGSQVTDLRNAVDNYKQYIFDGAPMYKIYDSENSNINIYNANGGVIRTDSGGSLIHKCPNYLAFRFLTTSARMYLYIGDFVNGVFVPDLQNYLLSTTSGGNANYLKFDHGQVLQTAGKYFCYKKNIEPENIELCGIDELPQTPQDNLYCKTSYFCTSGGISSEGNRRYYGYIVPPGSAFAVVADPKSFNTIRLSYPLDSSVDIGYNVFGAETGRTSFGVVPDNVGFGMITIGNTSTSSYPNFEQVKLYVFVDHTSLSGFALSMNEITTKVRQKSWLCLREMYWSGKKHSFKVGEAYFAIPYSSRWVNSHFVGYEVSLETAYNAANDEYSIWYDDTEGRTELGARGGPGYGLVCSSYASLLMGSDHPQTNYGYTHDADFDLSGISSVIAGECYTDIVSHVTGISTLFANGCATNEFSGFTALNHIRTSPEDKYRTLRALAGRNIVNNYGVHVGYNGTKNKTNLLGVDFALANGSVRPWRGNKSVYGLWDKSKRGSGIFVTLHGAITTVHVVTPSGTDITHTVNGEHILDISSDVEESGTYELYSDLSNTREYFRYYNTPEVEMQISETGLCTFDNENVLYCYVTVYGSFGGKYEHLYSTSGSAMTLKNGGYYPYLSGHNISVHAAIIADPETSSWGCYSVPCDYEYNYNDNTEGDDKEVDPD